MGRIKSYEEFLERLEPLHPNIKFENEFTKDDLNRAITIKCICKIDGREWNGRLLTLYKGHGCQSCSSTRNNTKYRETVEELQSKLPEYIKILSPYLKSRSTKLECKCEKHDVIFYQAPATLKQGFYCYKCGEVRCNMTEEQFLSDLKMTGFNIKLIGKFEKLAKKTEFLCLTHNITWSIPPREILKGRGCEMCKREKLRDNPNNKYYCELFFSKYPHKKDIPASCYFLKFSNDNEVFFKMGITTKGAEHRIKALHQQTKKIYNIEILSETKNTLYECWKEEQWWLNRQLKHLKYKPKIKFDGYTECFVLYDSVTKEICKC